MDHAKEEKKEGSEETTTENEVVTARDQILAEETTLGLLGLR